MITLLLILHVFSCLFLISLILVQRSQGADMGAAFGGASQTVFGSRGPATFLNKLTIIIAVIFLGASLALAYIAKHSKSESVVEEAQKTKTEALDMGETVIDTEPAEEEKEMLEGKGAPANVEKKTDAREKRE